MSLEIINLYSNYGLKTVLKNINLKINKGELLAIIGPNGAGKTTLLKCILGVKSYKGKIIYDGIDLSKISEREKAKIISYLPQFTPIIFPITIFENVLLGRLPYFWTIPKKEDIEFVNKILKDLNLIEYSNRYIDEVSGGERQRAYIARIIAQNSKIMLFDEPTANLDLKYQLEIMELIRKITKERNTITIIAIHEVNLAFKYADRIVLLNDGEIICNGSPNEVINMINKVYEVNGEIIDFNGRPRIIY
jgi:iron complex transport system ATP-binding protein